MNEIKNGGDRRSCYEKTEAHKAGYKTIADIGKKSESPRAEAPFRQRKRRFRSRRIYEF